ncbi:Swt1 family HEPN domain-containing protein [Chloracidobacterium thermophilum]|uniref:Swt1 family HEPN domain-containing protein n=1 Tax=Chloracidobacterium thermophilum TaxID=458033 RepID=UPI0007387484|nr:Swt1 family HEPN domain-containing protein [Chloracidobacterium thermophilum]
MAVTNQERVGKGLELLRAGLGPYVEREVQEAVRAEAVNMETVRRFAEDPSLKNKPIAEWDAAGLLKLMWETWNEVFRKTLGFAERSLVSELRNWRNKWAHQKPFSSDDADRALDSMERLLTAVSAPQADDVKRLKMELRRLVFQEQVRNEKRKAGGSLVEASANGSMLKPWREVVAPHPDVASGRYQQAEFAADLWQVHLGGGSDEYQNPAEFFRRTFLTASLKRLLVGAVQRLSGTGGDPVVQLQTNFGGGKTHSMLALYHLFSGVAPAGLAGVEELMANAGVTELPKARRVVLVGNKISPGNPSRKPDGTLVRTLWGELAWQLGGREAYARLAADDERATNPGDVLRELFKDYGPCLILMDEWVAYARQLHDAADLPGGSFETQFTFAQALTESARLAGNCLLVISLPASDTQANDEEVGGLRGREALDRLRNVVARVESSWRPASAEEGFEIVRRRLFEPLPGPEAFTQRDLTARAFADLYGDHSSEFPPECKAGEYERRLQAAYPIHPEVFDRLYEDWSTLVKFQRTRGVLRLMAAVIHSLWEQGDRSPLILPSTIPMDDPRVQFELTRYLSDNWTPIIEKDVDGPGALPLKIDGELPNLGRLSATRRVARTMYLGSAPTTATAHRGLEDRRVKLGCVMPGESPAIFGDALRRLAAAATYLYQDGTRFWYATQPTVTKLAEDRAEQLRRDPDRVAVELEARIRANVGKVGDFPRVHPWPRTSADVPDDFNAGLVILPPDQPYSKEAGNAAETAARALLEYRGNHPRRYRNTLVFLAADKVRLPDLEEALRRFLAWRSILDEKEVLNLDPHQVRQAETQLRTADLTVSARLPEAYQWLLVPEQPTPQAAVTWQALRLTGADALAVRASRKLKGDDLLVEKLGGTVLRRHLDAVPLWRGNHVSVRQLVEDFASYLYLPRLTGPGVLVQAIRDGVALFSWEVETYAYAESYEEKTDRYHGLRGGQAVQITPEDSGLVVKAEVAQPQLAVKKVSPQPPVDDDDSSDRRVDDRKKTSGPRSLPRRYHGTVRLDPTRVGRDAGRIAEEVIAHLAGQPGAEVVVTLEIQVRLPDGATEHTVRTVTENSRFLNFETYGFESD